MAKWMLSSPSVMMVLYIYTFAKHSSMSYWLSTFIDSFFLISLSLYLPSK